jgi:hypothetical protein
MMLLPAHRSCSYANPHPAMTPITKRSRECSIECAFRGESMQSPHRELHHRRAYLGKQP